MRSMKAFATRRRIRTSMECALEETIRGNEGMARSRMGEGAQDQQDYTSKRKNAGDVGRMWQ